MTKAEAGDQEESRKVKIEEPKKRSSSEDGKTRKSKKARKNSGSDLTSVEGQLAANPGMTLDEAKVAAKKEYHRLNAADSRRRQKEMVENLKAEYARLKDYEKELKRKNEVLKAQVEILKNYSGNAAAAAAAASVASGRPQQQQQAPQQAPMMGMPMMPNANPPQPFSVPSTMMMQQQQQQQPSGNNNNPQNVASLLSGLASLPENQKMAIASFLSNNTNQNGGNSNNMNMGQNQFANNNMWGQGIANNNNNNNNNNMMQQMMAMQQQQQPAGNNKTASGN